MDDKPFELLPFGQTRADYERLEAKKRAGRRGVRLFMLELVAIALVIVYCAGWMAGKSG